MNEEIGKKWVAALRSGEYDQGRGYLNANSNFCCLGVLCDLAVKEGVVAEHYYRMDGITRYGYGPADGFNGEGALLPRGVKAWAGMSSVDGTIREESDGLAAINDMGYSFSYIADLIEREMENL